MKWLFVKWLFGKRKTSEGQKNDRPACVKLDDCLFVKRHGKCPEFSIKRYNHFYCTGPRMEECARLRFYNEKEYEPSEHMAPTGLIIENYRK